MMMVGGKVSTVFTIVWKILLLLKGLLSFLSYMFDEFYQRNYVGLEFTLYEVF